MALHELEHQADIVKSVKKDGGYARKISHQYAVGIPDLLIGHAPFIPILAEVKDLGVKKPGFSCKIDTTPKQEEELRRFGEPYKREITPYTPEREAAIILIHYQFERVHYLAGVKEGTSQLTDGAPDAIVVMRQPFNYWDIRPILEGLHVAKVRLM